MRNIKIILIALFLFLFNAETLMAIPAFARKYRMTCKTCHSPFPKLKPYGDEFAANGFVLADKDAPRYYVETGDKDLTLIRDLPFALRLEGYVTYNNSNSERTSFETPYLLKLLSGGSITKDVSYYFYFFFSERGEVAGIEDAFLMFNNIGGSELDIYLGQFQISDPLFKRELRLTLEDYLIYKTTVGESKINLTYDRGVMFTYGFPSGTDLILEVLNGNGISAPDNFRNFDNDKYKNLMLRASQEVNENFRIGAFGYWGKEKSNVSTNELWMLGPDATISTDQWELNLQYVERRDNNPFFQMNAEQIKTRGGFAELIYRPEGDNSNWYAVGLFNLVESDLYQLNERTAAVDLGYMLRRNIRLVGEVSYNLNEKFVRIGAGFVTAF